MLSNTGKDIATPKTSSSKLEKLFCYINPITIVFVFAIYQSLHIYFEKEILSEFIAIWILCIGALPAIPLNLILNRKIHKFSIRVILNTLGAVILAFAAFAEY